MKIHFMGIGGSGMSAVAQIARAYGFEVSGCDMQADTPYLAKLKAQDSKLKIFTGHATAHLDDTDLLCVTPAVFFQNSTHPEYLTAKEQNIVMTWQEFMGKYLHKDKFVICVAGTHGKSTTTAMVGQVLLDAGLDPTAEVGATVPAWHSNVIIGTSKYFVSEADEYYHNFLHYHPDVVILNNIEMDHPEYFKTLDTLLTTYQKFIDQIKPEGILIYNSDSPNIKKLRLPKNAIGYSVKNFPNDLKLGIAGDHNKANAMGVIKLAEILEIDYRQALQNFAGIGRRLELIGDKHGVKVYDDYANLPTAFAANLQAIKELHPTAKIWVVIEPHTFSRLRVVLGELKSSLQEADHIIISKVFASRETDPGDFSGADIATACGGHYIPEFADIVHYLQSKIQDPAVVLVMGSGNSYQLSRQILTSL